MSASCAKCGSDRIITDAKIFDQGEYSDGTLKAAFEQNPEAWFFKGRILTNLRAVICGACGYTELYAQDPGALYKAFQPPPVLRRRLCLECGADIPDGGSACAACGAAYRSFEANP